MIKIFHFLLNVLEFSYKKKILKNLKENLPNKMNSFFDIGAHHGETTIEMHKNFSIENFFLFEPSIKNFHELKKQLNKKNRLLNNLLTKSKFFFFSVILYVHRSIWQNLAL